jgi:hypothetical protein
MAAKERAAERKAAAQDVLDKAQAFGEALTTCGELALELERAIFHAHKTKNGKIPIPTNLVTNGRATVIPPGILYQATSGTDEYLSGIEPTGPKWLAGMRNVFQPNYAAVENGR